MEVQEFTTKIQKKYWQVSTEWL